MTWNNTKGEISDKQGETDIFKSLQAYTFCTGTYWDIRSR